MPQQRKRDNYDSMVGQIRVNAQGRRVEIVGCCGYGSGGYIYVLQFIDSNVVEPNCVSHDDMEKEYPVVVKQRR